MLGNRFGAGAEKLEAGARRSLEHACFKEKVGDVFHE
jgi:hypothetical protein